MEKHVLICRSILHQGPRHLRQKGSQASKKLPMREAAARTKQSSDGNNRTTVGFVIIGSGLKNSAKSTLGNFIGRKCRSVRVLNLRRKLKITKACTKDIRTNGNGKVLPGGPSAPSHGNGVPSRGTKQASMTTEICPRKEK